jgi:hypothetical protein
VNGQRRLKNRDLWNRIRYFRIDDDSSERRFVDRLAAENGWARAYAEEVVEEYLKFVYLMASGDETRTPSDAVDQAWHLHLSYSRSYWDDLCARVLGKQIYHSPTKGGAQEEKKFRSAYERTLAAYEAEFGTKPPPRIWPPAEQRFKHAQHRRVDLADRYVIGRTALIAVALTVGAALVVAAVVASVAESSTVRGAAGAALVLAGVPAVGLGLLWLIEKLGIRGGKSRGGCGGAAGCGGGCGGGGCGGGG